ncbi:tyrosine--tRNA ligase [Pullulanibacillus sp. KACC 23026]|uniref:tyrosine--tRNA ligase n=1 Tax=Pullulanibacillus sp. KACC 23026 TaxID=3028315 RepID=UPI0023AEB0FC|nr:tyrosine--tRNA ligase [Pullulanibacillus sp. KACC 23026]WEG10845.1 tyrosine--tRNA ligase [Pullulanibacillus sp. KACC 23026]
MNLLQDLENRGLLYQVTDREALEKLLEEEKIALYCGFDPTGDSLHIGHLVTIVTMRRFQLAGHTPIALVGGGTGMIGDPSGRSTERNLNELSIVQEWSEKIKRQLMKSLDFDGESPAKMMNNYDWLGKLSMIEFLRDVGKHFPVNYMLNKDSVTSRMENGISFTEFSYMILQAYDFLNLYEKAGCRLQIGGSDQWGNITAGLELIRRNGHEAPAFGVTFPLITKSDGTKFGKTAGEAIWLDPEKTTPYEFYQFWLNTEDRDVIRFIKYFTFISEEEVAALEKEVETAPEKRVAQRRLAEELTIFVHSEEALQQAVRITEALFSGELSELTASDIKQGFKQFPTYQAETKEEIGLIDLLVSAGVVSSKRQAREDIQNGAVYVNGHRITDVQYTVTAADRIEDQFTIIRRGKKKYTLIKY